ncbi:MAG: NAD(P)/FAD-dependent oxidoreductase [Candidatus Hodarchaeota archaeon]
MNLVVIGGGAAGSQAALEAKKIDRSTKVVVVEKQKVPQYSLCGLPYALSGEIPSFDDLVIFPFSFYQNRGIDLRLSTVASMIDTKTNTVTLGGGEEIPFDSLIIATGASPKPLEIKGLDKKGVFYFRMIEDGWKISEYAKKCRKAVVKGFGLVALEAAVALKKIGLDVTIVARRPAPMRRFIDRDIGKLIIDHLRDRGINIMLEQIVEEIIGEDEVSGVITRGWKEGEISDKTEILKTDMVIIGGGVKPNIEIAQKAGIESTTAGIIVDKYLETNVKGIYAVGDCALVTDFVTGKRVPSFLGTNAVRAGKTAGINALGGRQPFKPVLNVAIIELFDLIIGSLGINTANAIDNGIEFVEAKVKGNSRAEYYPGGKEMVIKLLSDLNGRIIGGQIIGQEEIFSRITALAFGVQQGMNIEDLAYSENCYTPPLSPVIDPLQIAAQVALKKLERAKKRDKHSCAK